jgi:hypothetical protein
MLPSRIRPSHSPNPTMGCERAKTASPQEYARLSRGSLGRPYVLESGALAESDTLWSYAFRVVIPLLTIAGGFFTYFIRKSMEDRSVNRAILAEVNRLITIVRRHYDWWEPLKSHHSHPLIPFSYAVYKQHVKNVGVLERDLVGAVVQFYGYLQFINDVQARRKRFENTADFEGIYTRSLETFLDLFEHRFDEEFKQLNWTLEKRGEHSTWKI